MIAALFKRLRTDGPISHKVNHVSMFRSAAETCPYCAGSGWRRDWQNDCVSRCMCVDRRDEAYGNQ